MSEVEKRGRDIYFLNQETEEITENHREAVEWFRQKKSVLVYERKMDGTIVLRMRWDF